mgnify:CR=1 FL=1
MLEIVKVSTKGQIVIPEKMRTYLDIKEGSQLVVRESEGRLILEPEKNIITLLDRAEIDKERMGWLLLAEKSMEKIWDNPKDERIWKKYL